MRKGFTLVELSIVLVIIGILIGGILVAQSMIETTKVQRFIMNLQQYEVAVNNFKSNYKYYPGDDSFFTPPGNRDGELAYGAAGGVSCTGIYSNYETEQAFAHVSQAKMLDVNYPVYGPDDCGSGGPHNPSMIYTGAVVPVVEMGEKYSALFGQAKYPIYPNKVANGNLYFDMRMRADWVIPIQTKLGVVPADDKAVGIVNPDGAGTCKNAASVNVSCTSSTAYYGRLRYYIAPI